MAHMISVSRRTLLSTGIGSAAAALIQPQAFAGYKNPNEIRVVFLGGDYYHNGITQEKTWRRVFGVTNWRLMFAQDLSLRNYLTTPTCSS